MLTMVVNVPMNEALAEVAVPEDMGAAARIWADYSRTWQVWNVALTLVSGGTLALAGVGIALAARS